ncbi:MAG: DUF86 domain-containing protein [Muribaculaceae bacterium]|nr:DUF86 domain-containing protein [Muribaculaceae bacterium]
MLSKYSDTDKDRALLTLQSIAKTIDELVVWNKNIHSVEDYYSTQTGMQLLAANCTLITAIGEGINRMNRILPEYLSTVFPDIPWRAIIGMRNHIAHGYFELDADLVFEAVKKEIPILERTIAKVISDIKANK